MAAISSNADQVRQFDRGGRLIITTSTDTHTLNNKMPGTLTIKDGGTDAIEFKEAGVPQVPILGDANYSEIEIDARMAFDDTTLSTNDIDSLFRTVGSAGLVSTFTLYIDTPTYKGSTKWKRLAYANCFFVPGECTIVGGTDYDRYKLKIRSATAKPTETLETS